MSEPKRNILPVMEDPEDKPRQRARTMSRKEMARMFRHEAAAGGSDPELQALMAERAESGAGCRGGGRGRRGGGGGAGRGGGGPPPPLPPPERTPSTWTSTR